MEKRKIIGIISIVIGIVFLLNSQITGAVISTSIGTSISFIVGIVLLIGGIGLMLGAERKRILGEIEKLVEAGIPQSDIKNIQEKVMETYKKEKKENRAKIYQEIADVIHLVQEGKRTGTGYNLHQLKDKEIFEADAKVLNRLIHQGGRGTERYLFDRETGKMLGIAYHPRGDPTKFSWRVEF